MFLFLFVFVDNGFYNYMVLEISSYMNHKTFFVYICKIDNISLK